MINLLHMSFTITLETAREEVEVVPPDELLRGNEAEQVVAMGGVAGDQPTLPVLHEELAVRNALEEQEERLVKAEVVEEVLVDDGRGRRHS